MEIVKRGYKAKDVLEFGQKRYEKLNKAGNELYHLLNWGYNAKSASTFIGNHYLLSERQRLAIVRSISSENMLQMRKQKEIKKDAPLDKLVIDGFNLIITSDSIILNKCKSWYNLGRYIIDESISDTWIFNFDIDRLLHAN